MDDQIYRLGDGRWRYRQHFFETEKDAISARNQLNSQTRTRVVQEDSKEELWARQKSQEEIRAAADKQLHDDRWQKVISPKVGERITAVLQNYPWYKDTVRNGQTIARRLSTAEAVQERRRQHREDNDYSLLEIASALESAAAAGELDINETAASKHRIENYREQLASVSQAEDELYAMPREEFDRRARGLL